MPTENKRKDIGKRQVLLALNVGFYKLQRTSARQVNKLTN